MADTPRRVIAVRFMLHPTEPTLAAVEFQTDARSTAYVVNREILEDLARSFQSLAATMPYGERSTAGAALKPDTFSFREGDPDLTEHT